MREDAPLLGRIIGLHDEWKAGTGRPTFVVQLAEVMVQTRVTGRTSARCGPFDRCIRKLLSPWSGGWSQRYQLGDIGYSVSCKPTSGNMTHLVRYRRPRLHPPPLH